MARYVEIRFDYNTYTFKYDTIFERQTHKLQSYTYT